RPGLPREASARVQGGVSGARRRGLACRAVPHRGSRRHHIVVRLGGMAKADYLSPGAIEEPLITADVEVVDPALLLGLTGPSGDYLRILEQEFGVAMGLRGNTIRVAGADAPL